MRKITAKIISFVLNPLLIFVFVPYILVLKTTDSLDQAFFWEIFSLVFMFALFAFILIGIIKGFFSDFDISNRKQRPLLFSFSIFLAAAYIVLLYFLRGPEILFIAIFGIIIGITAIEIINRFTKASIHVATVAAFATSLSLVYGGIFFLTFFLIPVVAWARIITHNHTRKQTIIGATLGILTTLTV